MCVSFVSLHVFLFLFLSLCPSIPLLPSLSLTPGLDRGYVGAPPDVIIQPLNHTDYTAVTNYSCSVSPSFMCTASLGSCTDGYAIVTCANGQ